MHRLLWKEFHEAKWYLLSLLAIPWIVSLWCTTQSGVGPSDMYALCFWVCTLPIAFLASTRVQKDMQANQLSSNWLPVNRWVGLLAKFAPGMIVVLLVPAWLRFVVTVCAGDPVVLDHLMTATAASIYAFTFAVSMFLPSLPAALVGVAAAMVACGWSIKTVPPYVPREIVISALAAIAITACIGVWARTDRTSIRRRASGALTGVAAGLIPVLVIGFLASVHSAGGPKEFRAKREQYLAQHKSRSGNRDAHTYLFGSMQASPDGRSLAYVVSGNGERTQLEVREIGGRRAIISDSTASPAGWLRNGDLLVFTGTPRTGAHLNRYYRGEKRLVKLASFPACRGQRYWQRPIVSVVPNPSSDRVALLILPPSGGLPDLWVVDAHKGNPKLVRRSLKTQWSDDGAADSIAWSGDSIIMVRQSEYWRIPLDGSRPRYITNSRKEVRRG